MTTAASYIGTMTSWIWTPAKQQVLDQITAAVSSIQASGLGETAPAWQLDSSWNQNAKWTDHFFVLGVRDLLQWAIGITSVGPLSGQRIIDVDKFEIDTELRFGAGRTVYRPSAGQPWQIPGPYAEGCHFGGKWLTGHQSPPLCVDGHGPYQCTCGPTEP